MSFFKNKSNRNLLILLIAGVIITALSLIITDVRGSCDGVHSPTFLGCAQDADIGWYLLIFFGIFVALVAVAGLCAQALSKLPSPLGEEARYATAGAIVTGLSLIVIGVLTAPLQNRAEVEQTYKCPTINWTTGESTYQAGYKYSEHCQNLKGAPGAKIKYVNTAVYFGAALLLTGCFVVVAGLRKR